MSANNCLKPVSQNQKLTLFVDNNYVTVTQRQADCLKCLLEGMSAKQTARKLCLSHRTVETHLDALRRRMNCANKIMLLSKIKFSGAF